MATIVLNIPDQLEMNQPDMVRFIAAKLYEAGKLTLGQAAQFAGLSKVAFAEILGDYNCFRGDTGRLQCIAHQPSN
jgi:predicted HTH domain antitoxin